MASSSRQKTRRPPITNEVFQMKQPPHAASAASRTTSVATPRRDERASPPEEPLPALWPETVGNDEGDSDTLGSWRRSLAVGPSKAGRGRSVRYCESGSAVDPDSPVASGSEEAAPLSLGGSAAGPARS